MPSFVPLVQSSRGEIAECLHFGAVAACDANGRLIASAGDPRALSYTRSTLKPLQALPLVHSGAARRFGFDARQLAITCASHSGEPMHVQQVDAVLAAAGLARQRLQCGCHVPIHVQNGLGPPPAAVDERHHNCSGKHAGFLAWCVLHGQPLESYLEPSHPLQVAVRDAVAQVSGTPVDELRRGTDGCSAPNYAMPLANLARAYARLALGTRDAALGASLEPLAQAMVTHPELVSGTGRSDLAFARAGRGDWICKGGADGVQAVASRSRGEAFAVKVSDGSAAAVQVATAAVLDQLGWLDDAQRHALAGMLQQQITNFRATVVGRREAVFRLSAHPH